MRHLDLFAGIGGFSLAASWYGIQTTQFVEIDPFCQQILRRNFPGVSIHDDISTFTAEPGQFDIITAGFPCQDASECNPHGTGLAGNRTGLITEVFRIVRTVQPSILLLENVPGLIDRGFRQILWELAFFGFDAEWQTVSASSMGAPHRRRRLFIIAYPEGTGKTGISCPQKRPNQAPISGGTWWQQNPHPQPTIHPLDDGISRRLARQQLQALGNTVVPQCVAVALDRIMELAQ